MKKGFTLIELLAVIVILAIIALIAVPIILNIIGDTKKESNERSKELYLEAVKNAIAKKNLTEEFNPKTCEVTEDGNLTCDVGELIVEVNGNKPCEGSVTFDNGIVREESVKFICEPPSFANDSWDKIIANVQSGNADVYKVGETKEITLAGFDGTYIVRVANNSTPEECSGVDFSQTACGFVIEFEDVITKSQMNTNNTNIGGWENSKMRTYVNDTIFKALPSELQNSIIDTKVVSGYGSAQGEGKSNFTTTDKIYLLSLHEIYEDGSLNKVNTFDTACSNTRQLDYYKNKELTLDNGVDPTAIKKYNGTAASCWLRTAYSGVFLGVNIYGDMFNYSDASDSYGVAPAFRIG